MRLKLALLASAAGVASALTFSFAQAPKLVPMPAQPPAAQDKPYPGAIELEVDATDVGRAIFRVHEKVPVAGAGPLTLLYPSWLPGDHSPSGQIDKLAGLTITANGAAVPWKRNPIEVTAFNVDVPKGVKSLDLTFQFVSATADSQGPVVMDRNGLQLEWNSVLLYPAGYYSTRIMFAPRLTLPAGWTYATALGHGEASGPVTFAPTDLSTLVDSPLFAGRYAERVDLDPGGRSPVFLNIFADRPDQLKYSDDQMAKHKALVKQADLLFGARHFDHYDFLFDLSDRLQGVGLEHHRSSENGVPGGYFTDWDNLTYERDLLAHEMTHSWNGKYRRPADLWIPDFNTPMRDSLLWVYEGQTQYWGQVLAARSGLFTKEEALDSFALTLATYDMRAGRNWKPLIDTTNDPVSINRAPQAWRSWSREEDYYQEGQLIWLDADTLIREKSGGKKSLDDFAKLFFGQHDGDWAPVTYTFDDVVKAL
ncbi:MAG TPA: hypothetical protein VG942_19025, partial [Hyphomonadaceae bacterium]|nr:hypothetical protein [Hyphomonadaceae bacterium]